MYDEIPADAWFLHVHFYQPLVTMRQWVDKSFALHCVKFLSRRARPEHNLLLDRILAQDQHGWYEASLRLCGCWDVGVTMS